MFGIGRLGAGRSKTGSEVSKTNKRKDENEDERSLSRRRSKANVSSTSLSKPKRKSSRREDDDDKESTYYSTSSKSRRSETGPSDSASYVTAQPQPQSRRSETRERALVSQRRDERENEYAPREDYDRRTDDYRRPEDDLQALVPRRRTEQIDDNDYRDYREDSQALVLRKKNDEYDYDYEQRKPSRKDSKLAEKSERKRTVDEYDERRRTLDKSAVDSPRRKDSKKTEDRYGSSRASTRDSKATRNEHDAALPQNQFFSDPATYTAPYRPPTIGHAADYYGDQGESVHHQPGVRPAGPSYVVNQEQLHLQTPTADAKPPPEPSASGQLGAGASYFTMNSASEAEGRPSGKPSKPNRISSQPSKPVPSPRGSPGPPMQRPNAGMNPLAAAAMGAGATAGAGAAMNYLSGSQSQNYSSQHNSSGYDAHFHSGAQTQEPTDMYGSSSQPGPGRPNTSGNNQHGNISSGVQAYSQYSSQSNQYYTSGEPSYTSSSRPQPQHQTSDHHYGTAAAMGLAGAAAGAYMSHQHNSQQNSHQSYGASASNQNAYSYQGQSTAPGSQQPKLRRKRTGTFGRLANWWNAPDDVARFEDYTEVIGVCKDCFDPNAPAGYGPRKHHYHRKLRREPSRHGSNLRVDKTYRYSSSEDERKNKSSKVKKAAAIGLAGLGAAKLGETLYNSRHDFDDNYSVKSGKPLVQQRTSYSRRDDGKVHSRHVSQEDLRLTRKDSRGKLSRRSDQYASSSHRRRRSSGSSAEGRSRGNVASVAVGAAALGIAAEAAHRRRSRSRSNSRERPSSRRKYYSKRVSPKHSYVDLNATKQNNFGIGTLFSPSANSKKGKKSKGIFTFSNASSSSSDADLAFGEGTIKRQDSLKEAEDERRRREKYGKSDAAAIAGLAAAGVALASQSDNKGRDRVSADRRTGSRPQSGTKIKLEDYETTNDENDDIWEDASEDESHDGIDMGLAYGSRLSASQSKDSLASQSSGTGKWDWRWQKGRKERDDKKIQRRKSAELAQQRHQDPITAQNMLYSAQAPSLRTEVSERPFDRKTSAQVKPSIAAEPALGVFGVTRADLPQGPSPMTRNSMQYIDPIPVSDSVTPLSFTRDPPVIDPYVQNFASASQVPLQQPQPVSPVMTHTAKMEMIASEGPQYDDASLVRRETRPREDFENRKISAVTTPVEPSTPDLPGFNASTLSRQSVTWDLTPEQLESEKRAYVKEDKRRRKNEKADRRRTTDVAELQREAEEDKRRKAEETAALAGAVVGAGGVAAAALRSDGSRRDSARRASLDNNSRREADIEQEIRQLRAEQKRKQEEKKRRQYEEELQQKEEARKTAEIRRQQDEERSRAEAHQREVEARDRAEDERVRAEERVRQERGRDRRRAEEHQREQDERKRRNEAEALAAAELAREEEQRKTARDAESLASTRRKDSTTEDESKPRRRSSLKRHSIAKEDFPKMEEGAPVVVEASPRETQEERMARRIARKVSRSPSPVHEEYSKFFAPDDIKGVEERNHAAQHRDDVGARVIEIAPMDSPAGPAPSRKRSPFDSTHYEMFGMGEEHDPLSLPWRVPQLSLIEPTPPASMRDPYSPLVIPSPRVLPTSESSQPDPAEIGEPVTRTRSGSKVQFGDNDTWIYEATTPEYEKEDPVAAQSPSKDQTPSPEPEDFYTGRDSVHEGVDTPPETFYRPQPERLYTLEDDEQEAKFLHKSPGSVTPQTPNGVVPEVREPVQEDYPPGEHDFFSADPTPMDERDLADLLGGKMLYRSPFAQTVSDVDIGLLEPERPDLSRVQALDETPAEEPSVANRGEVTAESYFEARPGEETPRLSRSEARRAERASSAMDMESSTFRDSNDRFRTDVPPPPAPPLPSATAFRTDIAPPPPPPMPYTGFDTNAPPPPPMPSAFLSNSRDVVEGTEIPLPPSRRTSDRVVPSARPAPQVTFTDIAAEAAAAAERRRKRMSMPDQKASQSEVSSTSKSPSTRRERAASIPTRTGAGEEPVFDYLADDSSFQKPTPEKGSISSTSRAAMIAAASAAIGGIAARQTPSTESSDRRRFTPAAKPEKDIQDANGRKNLPDVFSAAESKVPPASLVNEPESISAAANSPSTEADFYAAGSEKPKKRKSKRSSEIFDENDPSKSMTSLPGTKDEESKSRRKSRRYSDDDDDTRSVASTTVLRDDDRRSRRKSKLDPESTEKHGSRLDEGESSKKRSKRSSRAYDDDDDDTRSVKSSASRSERKSKRSSEVWDDDDTKSTKSSSSRREKKDDDRKSNGFFSNIFGASKTDLSTPKRKDSKSSKSEVGRRDESEDGVRRKKRSSKSLASASVPDLSKPPTDYDISPAISRRGTENDLGIDARDRSTDDDFVSAQDEQSFLAERPEMPQPTATKDVLMGTDGVSGLNKGEDASHTAMGKEEGTTVPDEEYYMSGGLGDTKELTVPSTNTKGMAGAPTIDDLLSNHPRALSVIQPDLASQAIVNAAIDSGEETAFEVLDQTPASRPRALSAINTALQDKDSSRVDSPTRVRVPLFRKPPVTPRVATKESLSSPITAPLSPSAPKARQVRPKSTEFHSREFRPLYLVERHTPVKADTPVDEETLPALPSSRATSLTGSMEDLTKLSNEAVSDGEDEPRSRGRADRRSSLQTGNEANSSNDLLDSRSTTPVPGDKQRAREEETPAQLPQRGRREIPKYLFHSPSELLQDPAMLAEFGIEDFPPRVGSPLPSVVSTVDDQEFLSAESRPDTPTQDWNRSPPSTEPVQDSIASEGDIDPIARRSSAFKSPPAVASPAVASPLLRSVSPSSFAETRAYSMSSGAPFTSLSRSSSAELTFTRSLSKSPGPAGGVTPPLRSQSASPFKHATSSLISSRAAALFGGSALGLAIGAGALAASRSNQSSPERAPHDDARNPSIAVIEPTPVDTERTPKLHEFSPKLEAHPEEDNGDLGFDDLRDLQARTEQILPQVESGGKTIDRGVIRIEGSDGSAGNLTPDSIANVNEDKIHDSTLPEAPLPEENAHIDQVPLESASPRSSASPRDIILDKTRADPIAEGLATPASDPWESIDDETPYSVNSPWEGTGMTRGDYFDSVARSERHGSWDTTEEELERAYHGLGAFEQAFARAVQSRGLSPGITRAEAIEPFLPKRNNVPFVPKNKLSPIAGSEASSPAQSPDKQRSFPPSPVQEHEHAHTLAMQIAGKRAPKDHKKKGKKDKKKAGSSGLSQEFNSEEPSEGASRPLLKDNDVKPEELDKALQEEVERRASVEFGNGQVLEDDSGDVIRSSVGTAVANHEFEKALEIATDIAAQDDSNEIPITTADIPVIAPLDPAVQENDPEFDMERLQESRAENVDPDTEFAEVGKKGKKTKKGKRKSIVDDALAVAGVVGAVAAGVAITNKAVDDQKDTVAREVPLLESTRSSKASFGYEDTSESRDPVAQEEESVDDKSLAPSPNDHDQQPLEDQVPWDFGLNKKQRKKKEDAMRKAGMWDDRVTQEQIDNAYEAKLAAEKTRELAESFMEPAGDRENLAKAPQSLEQDDVRDAEAEIPIEEEPAQGTTVTDIQGASSTGKAVDDTYSSIFDPALPASAPDTSGNDIGGDLDATNIDSPLEEELAWDYGLSSKDKKKKEKAMRRSGTWDTRVTQEELDSRIVERAERDAIAEAVRDVVTPLNKTEDESIGQHTEQADANVEASGEIDVLSRDVDGKTFEESPVSLPAVAKDEKPWDFGLSRKDKKAKEKSMKREGTWDDRLTQEMLDARTVEKASTVSEHQTELVDELEDVDEPESAEPVKLSSEKSSDELVAEQVPWDFDLSKKEKKAKEKAMKLDGTWDDRITQESLDLARNVDDEAQDQFDDDSVTKVLDPQGQERGLETADADLRRDDEFNDTPLLHDGPPSGSQAPFDIPRTEQVDEQPQADDTEWSNLSSKKGKKDKKKKKKQSTNFDEPSESLSQATETDQKELRLTEEPSTIEEPQLETIAAHVTFEAEPFDEPKQPQELNIEDEEWAAPISSKKKKDKKKKKSVTLDAADIKIEPVAGLENAIAESEEAGESIRSASVPINDQKGDTSTGGDVVDVRIPEIEPTLVAEESVEPRTDVETSGSINNQDGDEQLAAEEVPATELYASNDISRTVSEMLDDPATQEAGHSDLKPNPSHDILELLPTTDVPQDDSAGQVPLETFETARGPSIDELPTPIHLRTEADVKSDKDDDIKSLPSHETEAGIPTPQFKGDVFDAANGGSSPAGEPVAPSDVAEDEWSTSTSSKKGKKGKKEKKRKSTLIGSSTPAEDTIDDEKTSWNAPNFGEDSSSAVAEKQSDDAELDPQLAINADEVAQPAEDNEWALPASSKKSKRDKKKKGQSAADVTGPEAVSTDQHDVTVVGDPAQDEKTDAQASTFNDDQAASREFDIAAEPEPVDTIEPSVEAAEDEWAVPTSSKKSKKDKKKKRQSLLEAQTEESIATPSVRGPKEGAIVEAEAEQQKILPNIETHDETPIADVSFPHEEERQDISQVIELEDLEKHANQSAAIPKDPGLESSNNEEAQSAATLEEKPADLVAGKLNDSHDDVFEEVDEQLVEVPYVVLPTDEPAAAVDVVDVKFDEPIVEEERSVGSSKKKSKKDKKKTRKTTLTEGIATEEPADTKTLEEEAEPTALAEGQIERNASQEAPNSAADSGLTNSVNTTAEDEWSTSTPNKQSKKDKKKKRKSTFVQEPEFEAEALSMIEAVSEPTENLNDVVAEPGVDEHAEISRDTTAGQKSEIAEPAIETEAAASIAPFETSTETATELPIEFVRDDLAASPRTIAEDFIDLPQDKHDKNPTNLASEHDLELAGPAVVEATPDDEWSLPSFGKKSKKDKKKRKSVIMNEPDSNLEPERSVTVTKEDEVEQSTSREQAIPLPDVDKSFPFASRDQSITEASRIDPVTTLGQAGVSTEETAVTGPNTEDVVSTESPKNIADVPEDDEWSAPAFGKKSKKDKKKRKSQISTSEPPTPLNEEAEPSETITSSMSYSLPIPMTEPEMPVPIEIPEVVPEINQPEEADKGVETTVPEEEDWSSMSFGKKSRKDKKKKRNTSDFVDEPQAMEVPQDLLVSEAIECPTTDPSMLEATSLFKPEPIMSETLATMVTDERPDEETFDDQTSSSSKSKKAKKGKKKQKSIMLDDAPAFETGGADEATDSKLASEENDAPVQEALIAARAATATSFAQSDPESTEQRPSASQDVAVVAAVQAFENVESETVNDPEERNNERDVHVPEHREVEISVPPLDLLSDTEMQPGESVDDVNPAGDVKISEDRDHITEETEQIADGSNNNQSVGNDPVVPVMQEDIPFTPAIPGEQQTEPATVVLPITEASTTEVVDDEWSMPTKKSKKEKKKGKKSRSQSLAPEDGSSPTSPQLEPTLGPTSEVTALDVSADPIVPETPVHKDSDEKNVTMESSLGDAKLGSTTVDEQALVVDIHAEDEWSMPTFGKKGKKDKKDKKKKKSGVSVPSKNEDEGFSIFHETSDRDNGITDTAFVEEPECTSQPVPQTSDQIMEDAFDAYPGKPSIPETNLEQSISMPSDIKETPRQAELDTMTTTKEAALDDPIFAAQDTNKDEPEDWFATVPSKKSKKDKKKKGKRDSTTDSFNQSASQSHSQPETAVDQLTITPVESEFAHEEAAESKFDVDMTRAAPDVDSQIVPEQSEGLLDTYDKEEAPVEVGKPANLIIEDTDQIAIIEQQLPENEARESIFGKEAPIISDGHNAVEEDVSLAEAATVAAGTAVTATAATILGSHASHPENEWAMPSKKSKKDKKKRKSTTTAPNPEPENLPPTDIEHVSDVRQISMPDFSADQVISNTEVGEQQDSTSEGPSQLAYTHPNELEATRQIQEADLKSTVLDVESTGAPVPTIENAADIEMDTSMGPEPVPLATEATITVDNSVDPDDWEITSKKSKKDKKQKRKSTVDGSEDMSIPALENADLRSLKDETYQTPMGHSAVPPEPEAILETPSQTVSREFVLEDDDFAPTSAKKSKKDKKKRKSTMAEPETDNTPADISQQVTSADDVLEFSHVNDRQPRGEDISAETEPSKVPVATYTDDISPATPAAEADIDDEWAAPVSKKGKKDKKKKKSLSVTQSSYEPTPSTSTQEVADIMGVLPEPSVQASNESGQRDIGMLDMSEPGLESDSFYKHQQPEESHLTDEGLAKNEEESAVISEPVAEGEWAAPTKKSKKDKKKKKSTSAAIGSFEPTPEESAIESLKTPRDEYPANDEAMQDPTRDIAMPDATGADEDESFYRDFRAEDDRFVTEEPTEVEVARPFNNQDVNTPLSENSDVGRTTARDRGEFQNRRTSPDPEAFYKDEALATGEGAVIRDVEPEFPLASSKSSKKDKKSKSARSSARSVTSNAREPEQTATPLDESSPARIPRKVSQEWAAPSMTAGAEDSDGSQVSESTRERRRRRRSPPSWDDREADDLPRDRASTPPPDHDDLMDTALGIAAGLGLSALTPGVQSSEQHPTPCALPVQEPAGWSFANVDQPHDSVRDSGVVFDDSPVANQNTFDRVRDSGFVASPRVSEHDGKRSVQAERSASGALRPPRPRSPTSSTSSIDETVGRRSVSAGDFTTPLKRQPSVVESTSKERDSLLFESSPAGPAGTLKTPAELAHLQTSVTTTPATPAEFAHLRSTSSASNRRVSPNLRLVRDSRGNLRESTSSPLSVRSQRDSYGNLRGLATSPLTPTEGEELASNLLDRVHTQEIDRRSFSPPQRQEGPFSPRESIDRVISPRAGIALGTIDENSLALGAVALGVVGGATLMSRERAGGSLSKSRTNSLRNLRQTSTSPSSQQQPQHLPSDGPAGDRSASMADSFDGYGVAPASPRSPSRPPSLRKRQSLNQVADLQARVDQLAGENRALNEQRQLAERHIDELHLEHAQADHATQEALKTVNEQLRLRDEEIARLRVEINNLAAARDVLRDEHENKYTLLLNEKDTAHSRLQESSRELEHLKEKHQSVSREVEGVVAAQVAAVIATKDSEFEDAIASKDAELIKLRRELDMARTKIRDLQSSILKRGVDEFIVVRDEDYFDTACQQLCQHVKQWVLRFSKFSDTRLCRSTAQVRDEKIVDRFDNAILDGSDVDSFLADRVKRRDVFMSVVMNMIWEYVFTRYLFGMDREQRQKLKQLEKNLAEIGPAAAVQQWRALTLTLLAKRPAFRTQKETDTEAVTTEIIQTLSKFLPPPGEFERQIFDSLRNVMRTAVKLSIEMRTQKAEYIMLPPLQPEYDTNGDLARKFFFNASLMNERSGEISSNEELEAQQAIVQMVLFPLVVKKSTDAQGTEEEIVVCPAQVLVARSEKGKKPRHSGSGRAESRAQSRMSINPAAMASSLSLGGMSGVEGNMI